LNNRRREFIFDQRWRSMCPRSCRYPPSIWITRGTGGEIYGASAVLRCISHKCRR